MNDITVQELATKIKIPVDVLIKKLSSIGIMKIQKDYLTNQEKLEVLSYLNKKKLKLQQTLILQRKIRSTLNIASIGGKHRKIQIEIRKNEQYIKEKLDRNNTNKKKLIIKDNKTIMHSKLNRSKTRYIKHIISKENQNVNNNKLDNDKLSLNDSQIQETRSLKKLKKSEPLSNTQYFNSKLKKNFHLLKDKKLISKKKKTDKFRSLLKRHYISKIVSDKKNENSNYLNAGIDSNFFNTNNHIDLKKNLNVFAKKIDSLDNKIYVKKHSLKIKKGKGNYLRQSFQKPKNIVNKNIFIGKKILVSELAKKIAVKSDVVIKKMLSLGIQTSKNESINQETAQLIAEDMGHQVNLYQGNKLEIMLSKNLKNNQKLLHTRPPIVTMMGHVDHGKTSLLDNIRHTKTVLKEAGGITQHIGAYHIKINNNIITFLDTPGHSAFTAMRARGAKVTDIIVLVVAIDDGVKPQTIEAIQHAKAANVPIIVAINKVDKPNVKMDTIKNDLMKYGILAEEWGGDNIFVHVSAKTGKGISTLLDSILLQAEMLELKASVSGMARGLVIESYLDKGSGPIATILVKDGILKKGDIIICGLEYGKIRAMRNEFGKLTLTAGPSMPVEILGLSGMPLVGEQAIVIKSEREARDLASLRKSRVREKKLESQKQIQLETLFEKIKEEKITELNIILKSDVQGSLEAILQSLNKLSTDKITIQIISAGVGNITGTDASLAIASNAIILGFNVRADVTAKKIIISENIDLRYYSVIYTLINEVKIAMLGLLKPVYKQKIIGIAEVRNVFNSPKFNVIAGCMVIEGIVKRNSTIRIVRNNIVIYEGELESLRRFKDDVNEIRSGMECGIGIKNYKNMCIGDQIEVYNNIEVKS